MLAKTIIVSYIILTKLIIINYLFIIVNGYLIINQLFNYVSEELIGLII
jgi:hypothetical protein